MPGVCAVKDTRQDRILPDRQKVKILYISANILL